jgi:transcriptional regulator with XRE-family HTH domain
MYLTLQSRLLSWARLRAGLEEEDLARKMGVKRESVVAWEESGRLRATQVDKLAHVTHTPVGYLYLNTAVQNRLKNG